jgi:galactokinase
MSRDFSMEPTYVRVVAPGRVNLIGDHTDYTGGLVFPMTIDRAMVIEGVRGGDTIELHSSTEATPAVLPLRVNDPCGVTPGWARYVAGVVHEMRPAAGFAGRVTTTIPSGAGLSSSAALELAVALALGFAGTPTHLAQLTQRAEQKASGVPCGIMDQLSIAAGSEAGPMLIDCHTLAVTTVQLPSDLDVVVIYGHHRTLVGSAYADRVAECAAAEAAIGPLRVATAAMVATITDPVVRARALHVVTENQRVRDFASALAADDRRAAGRLMVESHNSLRDLFETSTVGMDALVADVCKRDGVWGARMTGGGFGGCVVALAEPGVMTTSEEDRIWVVHPARAAHVAT